MQKSRCQRKEPLAIFDWNTHNIGDHVHWQLVRDFIDEFDGAVGPGRVDQGDCPFSCSHFELADHARCKPCADESALPGVIRGVHRGQHRAAHLWNASQARPVEGAEVLGVAVGGLHISVATQHPKTRVTRAGHIFGEFLPEHRLLGAQVGEEFVWEAVVKQCHICEVDHWYFPGLFAVREGSK